MERSERGIYESSAKERCPFNHAMGAVVCVILGHVIGRRFRSVASRFSSRRPVGDEGRGRRL
jgi:hypothetical protein